MLEEALVPIFINLIIFGSISFIIYTIVTTRNRERMAIIDRGLDLSLLINNSDGNNWRRFSILMGCLFIGVSLGYTVGLTISNVFYSAFHVYKVSSQSVVFSDKSGIIIIAMSFLFGGIGLLVSTFINGKMDKKD